MQVTASLRTLAARPVTAGQDPGASAMRESSSAATALADGIPEPPGLGARPGFVEVTEAVISLIRDDQLAELRAAEQVHEAFTVLTVSGAGPAEVLREVLRAAGLPVVLETLSRDVLA